jgi:hypothetical protein
MVPCLVPNHHLLTYLLSPSLPWEHRPPTTFRHSSVSDDLLVNELLPRVTHGFDVTLKVPSPPVPRSSPLSLSLWVPRQSLSGDAGWRSDPTPAATEYFYLHWFLIRSHPQVLVCDSVSPSHEVKDPTQASVNEDLEFLHSQSSRKLKSRAAWGPLEPITPAAGQQILVPSIQL